MKNRWKEMKYNEELDCWVVILGIILVIKCAVVNGLIFIKEMERLFPAVWN